MRWPQLPAHHRWLETETDRLLDFSRGAVHPEGGFAWLDPVGRPQLDQPVQLWITCRMTHVFALGHLMGRPGSADLVDHGVAALRGRFRDTTNDGWYAAVDTDGPSVRDKTAYEHAFVVLAASSAVAAGRPGADALLADALTVVGERFWDEGAGMMVEQWDEGFTEVDGYRGINSNMHAVEALLAAHDVTGDAALLDRARRITLAALGFARDNDGRLPEHFDAAWTPQPEYNREEPAHPFRPFGATIGHWFEWARLALHVRAAGPLGDEDGEVLLAGSRAMFDAGVREGWHADGTPGFVYTVDWAGRPVVRQRMHWVAAEATAAAYALGAATGDPSYAAWYERWWDHIATSFLDRADGSWWHELSPDLSPSAVTWPGKPDSYHAVQATLIPRLPLDVSLATGLRRGLLG